LWTKNAGFGFLTKNLKIEKHTCMGLPVGLEEYNFLGRRINIYLAVIL